MVCVPCIVIPFLLWFFRRYMRPLVEKLCPSMLKYLPGYSKPTEGEQYFSYIMGTSFSGGRSRSTWREPPIMDKQLEPSGKCPLSKTDQTQSSDKNSTETKTEVTAGDGGSKKTN